jgi:MscS family membrane protein
MQGTFRVRFIDFGAASLDLEPFAYIVARDFPEFLDIPGELLLAIMELGRAEGIRLALLSQTMYLAPKSAEGQRQALTIHPRPQPTKPSRDVA